MTYAGFLLLFLVLPLGVLLVLLRHHLREKRYWSSLIPLLLLALLAMAPWDHLAVFWGIWNWQPGQTWGVRFWLIPPEEYLFCILEAVLGTTAIFALTVWRRKRQTASVLQEPEV